MNELASIDSRTSMWMALLLRQVKTSPQRLALAAVPRVLRVLTIQGPNTSDPTLVNGGAVSVLSAGRSAMRCSTPEPRSFLQETTRWPPISQKPAWRMAPWVIGQRATRKHANGRLVRFQRLFGFIDALARLFRFGARQHAFFQIPITNETATSRFFDRFRMGLTLSANRRLS